MEMGVLGGETEGGLEVTQGLELGPEAASGHGPCASPELWPPGSLN